MIKGKLITFKPVIFLRVEQNSLFKIKLPWLIILHGVFKRLESRVLAVSNSATPFTANKDKNSWILEAGTMNFTFLCDKVFSVL